MMHDWLRTITDDYIVEWANKGLLRRGKKLLAQSDTSSWLVTEESAAAKLDGYEQQLNGAGFDHLQCSCPASGPCFHLTCFLSGLALLVIEQQALPASSDEKQNILLEPWIIESEEERIKQLGKASWMRAQRWASQKHPVEWQETPQALTAVVSINGTFRIYIPRTHDLSVATCSCKQTKCTHLAYLVLVLCQNRGLAPSVEAFALDDHQTALVQRTKIWLQHLLLQGLSGGAALHLSQGEAMVTELRQADLPRPSAVLAQLVNYQRAEFNRELTSTTAQLRESVARLHALLTALTINPLPQPFYTLVGEHRRRYTKVAALQLRALTSFCWQTESGYLGYSYIFTSILDKKIYTVSEARNRHVDPNWDVKAAENAAAFGTYSLKKLLGHTFTLNNAWQTQDGRVSMRDGSVVKDVCSSSMSDVMDHLDPREGLHDWIERIQRNPYAEEGHAFIMTSISELAESEFDQVDQVWRYTAEYESFCFTLILREQYAVSCIQEHRQTITGFIGRWKWDRGSLSFDPVALTTADCVISISREPVWTS